jgi:hypothetical protein
VRPDTRDLINILSVICEGEDTKKEVLSLLGVKGGAFDWLVNRGLLRKVKGTSPTKFDVSSDLEDGLLEARVRILREAIKDAENVPEPATGWQRLDPAELDEGES